MVWSALLSSNSHVHPPFRQNRRRLLGQELLWGGRDAIDTTPLTTCAACKCLSLKKPVPSQHERASQTAPCLRKPRGNSIEALGRAFTAPRGITKCTQPHCSTRALFQRTQAGRKGFVNHLFSKETSSWKEGTALAPVVRLSDALSEKHTAV